MWTYCFLCVLFVLCVWYVNRCGFCFGVDYVRWCCLNSLATVFLVVQSNIFVCGFRVVSVWFWLTYMMTVLFALHTHLFVVAYIVRWWAVYLCCVSVGCWSNIFFVSWLWLLLLLLFRRCIFFIMFFCACDVFFITICFFV